MANFFTDNKDIQFYVEKGIDWEPLVRLTEYDYKAPDAFQKTEEAVEFYRDILNMVGTVSAEEIASVSAEIDREGLRYEKGEVIFPEKLRELFDNLKALELHGMCLPRELGGMNCPMMLYFLNSEIIARGDASVMAHYGFHGGIAMALLMYSLVEGSAEIQTDPPQLKSTRFEKEITEIATGEAWGSMDITEPDAGSDMAALRCSAVQDDSGQWRLSGQKILITSGHGKYHFVIAKTEKSEGNDAFSGLSQLSLFLVPIYSVDKKGTKKWIASVDGLEKKLGHNGSATVTISYDETPAFLIGNRGEGFKLMLLLMNNARISVGFEALGLCEAAYRIAKEYAEVRPSMGKMIARHEIIADYLDEMRTDIQGIRALAIEAAYHEELAQKYRLMVQFLPTTNEPEKKKYEKLQRKHQAKSRLLTPLIKYRGAEKAVEIARRAVQILGGYGYTKDYGAEKLLRDAIVFPIYEGTSQIQALMAMKDNMMGILKDPQKFVQDYALSRTRSFVNTDSFDKRIARIQFLCYRGLLNLIRRVTVTKLSGLREVPILEWLNSLKKDWDPKKHFAPALLHAERITEMLTDKAIAEILYRQMKKFPEREEILIRFLERAEPRVDYHYAVITRTGERLLEELRNLQIQENETE